MKKLSLEEMEVVEGGRTNHATCVAAIVGMATSILGGVISFATLPIGGPASAWGLGVSIVGIYASGPGVVMACR